MEIGNRLKNARKKIGMTQEQVAEKIGVSRQTISNWENNKSYPDIVSVISLSDLYSVSLDELLKEDKRMIGFLEESTNEVKSREKFSRLVLIMSYLVIWVLSIFFFWFGSASGDNGLDAMGYALIVFYFVLPVSTFISSVFIGVDDNCWASNRWLMLLFFGFMYMLASYVTFSLANTTLTGHLNYPEIADILPGIMCSAVGMIVGKLIAIIKFRGQRKQSI